MKELNNVRTIIELFATNGKKRYTIEDLDACIFNIMDLINVEYADCYRVLKGTHSVPAMELAKKIVK